MFFKIGEFIAPVFIGGITSAGVAAIITPDSWMIVSMLIGMLLGMAAQVIVFILLMPLFGAFEIMVPAMLSGMSSGMLTGMLAATGVTGSTGIICAGILIGIAVWGFVWLRNRTLRGEVL